MMGLDFFRRSVEMERTYAGRGSILNTIQTNGTLLTMSGASSSRRTSFWSASRSTAPPSCTTPTGWTRAASPHSTGCMRGLDVLRRHEVDWNVLTTIHAVNGGHGREVYTFLRDDLGAGFIQFIPIIERADRRRPCRSPTPGGAAG